MKAVVPDSRRRTIALAECGLKRRFEMGQSLPCLGCIVGVVGLCMAAQNLPEMISRQIVLSGQYR